MNAASLELFRLNLLRQLAAVRPLALHVPALNVGAQAGGFTPSAQEMAAELDYLDQKKLIEPGIKMISPENREWKITAAGRDFLAERGLA